MNRVKILVSACLLGEKVRYDGGDSRQAGLLETWQAEGRVIPLCPEVAGGLPVPRAPAEIQADGRIINIEHEDVTDAFERGAQKALELCKLHQIEIAILKEGSPSCGSSLINNGNFDHTKIPGQGITTQLLEAHGVRVFSENELNQAGALLSPSD
ncbi:MAG TPA: DUF523 domain-containing protein [Mariprofundaceae bacterium]|nr:DUF523 domain-containing protein [Mariprofundaceae bacterium]